MARITESIAYENKNIDREAGIIREARILGKVSKNGREYSDKALNDAARLYEGVDVMIDHNRKEPNAERPLMESFGVIRNVRRVGDAVFGDLHFLKSHPSTNVILEKAERFPDKVGLSHNADGSTARRNGKTIVESVEEVISVDVVTRPATNKTLFESDHRMKTTVKKLIEANFKADKIKASKLLEMEGMEDMPVEMDDGASADDQIWGAFQTAILAAVNDETMDMKAIIKKVADILKAYEKLSGDGAGESTDTNAASGSEGESQMAESVNKKNGQADLAKIQESVDGLVKENAQLKKETGVRKLMESHGLSGNETLFESLMDMSSPEKQKKLCEETKALSESAKASKAKPRMSSVLQESQDDTKYPENAESFAKLLR